MRGMQIVTSTIAVAFAALIYSRFRTISLMYTNAPNRMEKINTLKDLSVEFAEDIRNCEDVVLDTKIGFALMTCDPGRDSWNTVMGPLDNPISPPGTGIYIWHYAETNSSPKKVELQGYEQYLPDFHPLGIEYQPGTQTITVVNLATEGARISLFKLSQSDISATHVGTFQHSLLSAPNSIAAIGETEYLITNDHFFCQRNIRALSMLETYLAIPGGRIAYVNLKPWFEGFAPKVEELARLSFANGIAQINESTIAVASSSQASVTLYTMERHLSQSTPRLERYRDIDVSSHADNLSVDENGKLLIAGHPHAPSLEKLSKNAARCNSPEAESKEGCDEIRAPSWIAEWSESDGLRTIYTGLDYDSCSTAARDTGRNIGISVGLYGKGLMTWAS